MKIKLLFSLLLVTNLLMGQAKHTSWTNKTYNVTGSWSLQKINDQYFFIIENDFKTSQGPDLKIFLVQKEIDKIDNNESVDTEGIFLGDLTSVTGAQRYAIPKNIDITKYHSIVIHCKKYTVVWGGVKLD
ncbi:MAG: DM13 domain-containing protein [Ginsengibacter sp.]